jgi:hypothetical protein
MKVLKEDSGDTILDVRDVSVSFPTPPATRSAGRHRCRSHSKRVDAPQVSDST